jgi:ABC-type uncharacterized transport system auxiliary subunit
MKKLLICLVLLFILFSLAGCKPKYVAAESMMKVYEMALNEMEKAITPTQMEIALLKIKTENLKAQNWYLQYDPSNPRLKQLEEMLATLED